MAHYAYKTVCYDIDRDKWAELVKAFEAENEREYEPDGNYDGDNWYIAEMWIREQIEEITTLRQQVAQYKADAERYQMARANPDFDIRIANIGKRSGVELDAVCDSAIAGKEQP